MVTSSDAYTPGPARHFVAWLLGATLLLVAGTLALNTAVDPLGATGRQTRWRVVVNAEVRALKLDLYRAQHTAPDTLVLGSSRSMRVNPVDIRRATGRSAFNLAVSGGTPKDSYLAVRWVEARSGVRGDFPHLVYGIDVDSFRTKRIAGSLEDDPRVAGLDIGGRSPRPRLRMDALGSLLELDTLETTARVLLDDLRGAPVDPGGGRTMFAPDGFALHATARHRHARPWVRRRVNTQMPGYINAVFTRDGFDGIEEEPLDYFTRTIRIANRHGDVPTVWLTPYQPMAEELLASHGYAQRRREVVQLLEEMQDREDVRLRFVDLSRLSSFGGDPLEFTDGIHMTPRNTRRVVVELARRALL